MDAKSKKLKVSNILQKKQKSYVLPWLKTKIVQKCVFLKTRTIPGVSLQHHPWLASDGNGTTSLVSLIIRTIQVMRLLSITLGFCSPMLKFRHTCSPCTILNCCFTMKFLHHLKNLRLILGFQSF
jgi:hypothetical protein